jgi:hypothetical protein
MSFRLCRIAATFSIIVFVNGTVLSFTRKDATVQDNFLTEKGLKFNFTPYTIRLYRLIL